MIEPLLTYILEAKNDYKRLRDQTMPAARRRLLIRLLGLCFHFTRMCLRSGYRAHERLTGHVPPAIATTLPLPPQLHSNGFLIFRTLSPIIRYDCRFCRTAHDTLTTSDIAPHGNAPPRRARPPEARYFG